MTPSPADRAAFREDLDELHRQALSTIGDRHYRHLLSIERWIWAFGLAGYATAWLGLNPFSILALALAQTAQWTIVAHHVLHRGYDRIRGVAPHHTHRGFARGWRRFVDWPDWIDVDAWTFEHNTLHHGHTGERLDPDLVEQNWAVIRQRPWPLVLKWSLVAFFAATWKLLYYAPNTFWLLRRRSALREDPHRRSRIDHINVDEPAWGYHGLKLLLPVSAGGLSFWGRCVLPYALFRFGLIPLLFLPLGPKAMGFVLINSLLAEVVTNIHTYAIIVPNHAGEDLHRFEDPARDKAEFYLRQVTGSTNYPGGLPWRDFLFGYLNYQIEHHLWPHLPALSYRELAPKVRAVCIKHDVPYVVEPLRMRLAKMVRLMTGQASMIKRSAQRDHGEPSPIAPPSPDPVPVISERRPCGPRPLP